MTKYVMIYYGNEDPQEDTMDLWDKWFASFEEKIVDWGNPFGKGFEITSDQTSPIKPEDYPATGYSIIETETFAEAEAIAKRCPSPEGLRLYEALSVE